MRGLSATVARHATRRTRQAATPVDPHHLCPAFADGHGRGRRDDGGACERGGPRRNHAGWQSLLAAALPGGGDCDGRNPNGVATAWPRTVARSRRDRASSALDCAAGRVRADSLHEQRRARIPANRRRPRRHSRRDRIPQCAVVRRTAGTRVLRVTLPVRGSVVDDSGNGDCARRADHQDRSELRADTRQARHAGTRRGRLRLGQRHRGHRAAGGDGPRRAFLSNPHQRIIRSLQPSALANDSPARETRRTHRFGNVTGNGRVFGDNPDDRHAGRNTGCGPSDCDEHRRPRVHVATGPRHGRLDPRRFQRWFGRYRRSSAQRLGCHRPVPLHSRFWPPE